MGAARCGCHAQGVATAWVWLGGRSKVWVSRTGCGHSVGVAWWAQQGVGVAWAWQGGGRGVGVTHRVWMWPGRGRGCGRGAGGVCGRPQGFLPPVVDIMVI